MNIYKKFLDITEAYLYYLVKAGYKSEDIKLYPNTLEGLRDRLKVISDEHFISFDKNTLLSKTYLSKTYYCYKEGKGFTQQDKIEYDLFLFDDNDEKENLPNYISIIFNEGEKLEDVEIAEYSKIKEKIIGKDDLYVKDFFINLAEQNPNRYIPTPDDVALYFENPPVKWCMSDIVPNYYLMKQSK